MTFRDLLREGRNYPFWDMRSGFVGGVMLACAFGVLVLLWMLLLEVLFP